MGVPIVENRPNETLHDSLAEARRNALEFRRQAVLASSEADRWDVVVEQLQSTLNLIQKPIGEFAKKVDRPVVERNSSRRGRILWFPVVQKILETTEWCSTADHSPRGPTKRELCIEMQKNHPEALKPTVMSAIYNFINTGKLKYKLDYLYLPEGEK